jgi:hypothetical protein
VTGHRGRQPSVAVAGDNGVHKAFEHRVRGAERSEVPEHSLERGGVHGEYAVEGALASRPCKYGFPVAPCLEPGAFCRSEPSRVQAVPNQEAVTLAIARTVMRR